MSPRATRPRAAQRAQAFVWLALLMPLLLGIAGLAIDGALMLTARRELQSVADGAARAAATRIDERALRESSGRRVQLVQCPRERDACQAAEEYLADRARQDLRWGTRTAWDVRVSGPRVTVAVRDEVPTAFMRIVHKDRIPIGVTARADVRHGVEAAVP